MTDTLEQIHETFVRLLREDGKLSVQNIADCCDISRNTFYYHYDSIEPLAAKVLEGWFVPPEGEAGTLRDCIEPALEACRAHRAEVMRLFNSPYQHVLDAALRSLVTKRVAGLTAARISEHVRAEDAAGELSLYSQILMGFLVFWLDKNMNADLQPFLSRLDLSLDKLYPSKA